MFNKNYFSKFVEYSFYFFPISFVLGSLIVNLNIIFFLLTTLIFLLINSIKIKLNLPSLSLLLFFLIIILSSLNNINIIGSTNLIKSFFLLKFFFLYLFVETLINNKILKIDIFLKVCLILILFVSLDLILQYFTGKNVLGYEPWEGRITGIFEHEAVAGSYLQKLFIFSSVALIFFSKFSEIKKMILFSSFFIIVILASYLASNRISFLMLFSSVIFLLIFFQYFRKKIFSALIILIPVFYVLYVSDPQIKNKYNGFVLKANILLNLVNKEDELNSKYDDRKNLIQAANNDLPNHGKIFFTAFKSFQEQKFFGNGLKSFRYKCYNYLSQKNTLCSTHPHNYHLEILHDVGLFGFLTITLFIIFLLLNVLKEFKKNKNIYSDKLIILLLILNFLIILFPLKSTGSIFTTWNGTLIWLSVALMNYKSNVQKN